MGILRITLIILDFIDYNLAPFTLNISEKNPLNFNIFFLSQIYSSKHIKLGIW